MGTGLNVGSAYQKSPPSPDGEGVGTVMQQAFDEQDLFAPAAC
jgi:hypothetical protein